LQNTENNSIFQWREWGRRCKIVDFWFSFMITKFTFSGLALFVFNK
jgi:hypothetical protein